MRNGSWLEPLRRELEDADAPRSFFFRDDDAGWANDRLLSLLDLFAHHGVPLDVAVIPAALDAQLAAGLRRRHEIERALLAFHQHGFRHVNHERDGRPCEFGPERSARAQRQDIATGARQMRELLGETAPIFTPPWNRCSRTTGLCLVELGFRALARDASADRLGLDELQEVDVNLDWSPRRGISLSERGNLLAAAVRTGGPVGVMLHHALVGPDELESISMLLALLASQRNVRCVALDALLRNP